MAKETHCGKCHMVMETAYVFYNNTTEHSEVDCLKEQLRLMSEDRNAWKEAWYRQREATGNVAWQYLNPRGY